jgi:hypothetical protein
MNIRSTILALTETLAFAIVYFCFGKLGLSLAIVNASATAVWPPTGLALAFLLWRGRNRWIAVFLGAFMVNVTTQGSLPVTIGIAAGNTLEAVTRFRERGWAWPLREKRSNGCTAPLESNQKRVKAADFGLNCRRRNDNQLAYLRDMVSASERRARSPSLGFHHVDSEHKKQRDRDDG